MVRRYGILIITVIALCIFLYYGPGKFYTPVEKINILSAAGIDVTQEDKDGKKYRITISSYTFSSKDQILSETLYGEGMVINQTRANRQLKNSHKFLSSLEKVILYGENSATHGIKGATDILFSNQFSNDVSWIAVCKNDARDMLNQQIEGSSSTGDYIDGLIDNSREYHYFSDNYKLIDVYTRLDEEGRSVVLPYMEMSEGKPKISGMTLFKKDKMIKKIDVEHTRIMNMLRESSGRGSLEYVIDNDNLISCYGKVKRTVDCKKIGSQYVFNINLNFTENVVNNTLYKDMLHKTSVIKKYEKDLETQTKKKCERFINEMQNNYRVDCLELGRVACAKYGRDTGTDWDEVISNSRINVNVRVRVRGFGRGMYAE
jgi:germination protein, Ger(x)C family